MTPVDWRLLRDFGVTPALAAVLCAVLIVLLRPVFARYAMARPNARSSHKVPTPQGAGIAVTIATVAAVLPMALLPDFTHADVLQLAVLCAAVAALAVVGWIDDIHTIDVLPRPMMLPATIQQDDYIVFEYMGAYSVALRTGFNGFYPDDWAIVDEA